MAPSSVGMRQDLKRVLQAHVPEHVDEDEYEPPTEDEALLGSLGRSAPLLSRDVARAWVGPRLVPCGLGSLHRLRDDDSEATSRRPELRAFSPSQVDALLEKIQVLLNRCGAARSVGKRSADAALEASRLSVAMALVGCPYLKQQLEGLKIITDMAKYAGKRAKTHPEACLRLTRWLAVDPDDENNYDDYAASDNASEYGGTTNNSSNSMVVRYHDVATAASLGGSCGGLLPTIFSPHRRAHTELLQRSWDIFSFLTTDAKSLSPSPSLQHVYSAPAQCSPRSRGRTGVGMSASKRETSASTAHRGATVRAIIL